MYRIYFKLLSAILLSLTSIAAPASGKEILYELVDTGVLNHSTHGQGIEMRIKPSSMPEGELDGEVIQAAMFRICQHYAPSVIPFVIEKAEIPEPSFIAVRIISGNSAFGQYVLQAYAIENDTCGDEL